MNSKRFAIFVLLPALVLAIYVFTRLPFKKTPPKIGTDQLSIDMNTLAQNSSESAVYGALLRLQKERVAYDFALQNKATQSLLIREAIAIALRNFNEKQAVQMLKELATDPQQSVHLAALESLSKVDAPAASELIEARLKTQINAATRSRLEAILYQQSKDKSGQGNSDILNKMINNATQTNNVVAVNALIQIAPQNSNVLKLLRQKVFENKERSVVALAMSHLAKSKDDWFIKNMPAFLENKDVQIRKTAIRLLHISCPSNRWQLLEKALKKEKDQDVILTAIAETHYLPGKEAESFLAQIMKNKKISQELHDAAKKQLTIINQPHMINTCSSAPNTSDI